MSLPDAFMWSATIAEIALLAATAAVLAVRCWIELRERR